MIQAFGIGCTLLLLIALAIAVYKGVPILVASPICGALCLLCNGMPVIGCSGVPFVFSVVALRPLIREFFMLNPL